MVLNINRVAVIWLSLLFFILSLRYFCLLGRGLSLLVFSTIHTAVSVNVCILSTVIRPLSIAKCQQASKTETKCSFSFAIHSDEWKREYMGCAYGFGEFNVCSAMWNMNVILILSVARTNKNDRYFWFLFERQRKTPIYFDEWTKEKSLLVTSTCFIIFLLCLSIATAALPWFWIFSVFFALEPTYSPTARWRKMLSLYRLSCPMFAFLLESKVWFMSRLFK